MINADVLIVTAPKQSGKTTFLLKWCNDRNDVGGILSPIINNERKFYNVITKEFFKMEAATNEQNVLLVGKYIFSQAAFQQAAIIIKEHAALNISFLVMSILLLSTFTVFERISISISWKVTTLLPLKFFLLINA